MTKQKMKIHVHKKGEQWSIPGELVEIVHRRLWAVPLGNFHPIYCQYKREQYQVQSTKGDLSDPFRRDESYCEHLFIEVK